MARIRTFLLEEMLEPEGAGLRGRFQPCCPVLHCASLIVDMPIGMECRRLEVWQKLDGPVAVIQTAGVELVADCIMVKLKISVGA